MSSAGALPVSGLVDEDSVVTLSGQVLDADGHTLGSGLVVKDGRVVEVLPYDESVKGWITPGFIDIHCHGGGGCSFPDKPTFEKIMTAINAHRQMGTTALLASTVSLVDPLPAIRELVVACESGDLIGIHMEGPYISPHKCGAQNPEAVRNPDLDELRTWLEAGKGYIRTMTIAPEVEGATEAAKLLLDYGAIPSWGHTVSSGPRTREVIAETTAYAKQIGFKTVPQTATHLFNAMPGITHRAPGPVRELLAAARAGEVAVELVADTIHVDADLVSDVVRFVEPENPHGVVFVTDAMAGAGMPDGNYQLGGLDVDITDGVAVLAGTDTIAGGTARIAEELQRLVRGGFLSIEQVVRAGVGAPATVLGIEGCAGVTLTFAPGVVLNAVVFTEDFEVAEVYREGQRLK